MMPADSEVLTVEYKIISWSPPPEISKRSGGFSVQAAPSRCVDWRWCPPMARSALVA